jgi:hypothetical protein
LKWSWRAISNFRVGQSPVAIEATRHEHLAIEQQRCGVIATRRDDGTCEPGSPIAGSNNSELMTKPELPIPPA